MARRQVCQSELSNGDAATAVLSAKEDGEGETERGRELKDIAVEVMHAW